MKNASLTIFACLNLPCLDRRTAIFRWCPESPNTPQGASTEVLVDSALSLKLTRALLERPAVDGGAEHRKLEETVISLAD